MDYLACFCHPKKQKDCNETETKLKVLDPSNLPHPAGPFATGGPFGPDVHGIQVSLTCCISSGLLTLFSWLARFAIQTRLT